MEDKEKKINVINKLLTLAEGNENSGERLAAKAKAYTMMNEYGIVESEIPILATAFENSHLKATNKNKTSTKDANFEPNSLKRSVNLLRQYLSLFFFVIWEIVKIPLVWQSLVLLGYFTVCIQVFKYLLADNQVPLAFFIVIFSFGLFYKWIKNLFFALIFCGFVYLFCTSLYNIIIKLLS